MDDDYEYCTNYHCAGDCGLRGHGTRAPLRLATIDISTTEKIMEREVTLNRIPVISTVHMPDTMALHRLKEFDVVLVAEYDEGGFVYLQPHDTVEPEFKWLQAIIDWAKANVFEWVRLDAEGDVIDGLPVYDWEREQPEPFEFAGTVIHGTHRPQDLIPAFMKALADVDPNGYAQTLNAVPAYVYDEGDRSAWWDSDDAISLILALEEALNDAAPAGWYFGAHPGDGSDFGFWPHECGEE